MTRSSPPQLSFSAGEISPLLAARADYQRVQAGVSRMCGFLPLRQGGFTRAPGTWYRGRTRADSPARLVSFQFAQNDAVVLEFSDLKMRVWRYGQPVLSGGLPYELTTPYASADLQRLQWVQSADVIYLADGAHPVQKLSRFALDNWAIEAAPFTAGPFRLQNIDKAVTVQASAATGTVTLTGTGSPFAADLIGSLMMLEPVDLSTVPLWTGNQAATIGDLCRYDGNIYELVAGTNTGVNPPFHLEGDHLYDAVNGTVWRFLSGSTGIVRITAVANANSATAEVVERLPGPLATAPTYRWSQGAWSARHGYPAAIEIYEQRLVAAATPADPRTVWFSTAGALEDFRPSVEPDGAFAWNIAGRQTLNRVLWLVAGQRGLHVGALGEECSTRSTTSGAAIGPTTTIFGFDSSYGSIEGRPIAPDGRPIFISRDGRRVIELTYAFAQDANAPRELSLPSEHLGQPGLAEIAWQSAPLRLAWFRRTTGDLAVMVYDPSEDVLGWATCPVAGGQVESMAVTASADGADDILTLIVLRQIDGQARRCVEEQALVYGAVAGDDPIRTANHLFCAAQFQDETPFSAIAVPHLAGQSVHVWTEAGAFGPIAADQHGNVVIGHPVTSAIAGLFDTTHAVRSIDLVAPARDGSALGRRKRMHKGTGLQLHRTAGGRIRTVDWDFARAERPGRWTDLVHVPVGTDADTAHTGAIEAEIVSNAARGLAVEFAPDGPKPMTVLAMVPRIEEVGA